VYFLLQEEDLFVMGSRGKREMGGRKGKVKEEGGEGGVEGVRG